MEDHYMTVVDAETFEVSLVKRCDVCYVTIINQRPVCYAGNTRYFPKPASKKELENMFSPELGFDSLDTNNFVNLTKIRKFDKKAGRVYFDEHPGSNSVYATVAKIKYPFVEKIIDRMVSLNNGTQIETKAESAALQKHFKRMASFNE